MAIDTSQSNLVILHTHLHTFLLKLSLTLHMSSPSPSSDHANSSSLQPRHFSSPHAPQSSPSHSWKHNPNDPLEVLYTLSPPAFHFLPRSLLLPAHVLRKGFTECTEIEPPLLHGAKMQIMVIPKGVRRVMIHYAVLEEVEKLKDGKEGGLKNGGQEGKGKLRKYNSRESEGRKTSGGKGKEADRRRSTGVRGSMDIEAFTSGAEYGVRGEDVQRVEVHHVVIRRAVKLPRKVWCGRNCKDQFEQLFIRRT